MVEEQTAQPENAGQLRMAIWTRIGELLERAQTGRGRIRSECAQAAASHLRLLEPWERYWLYPGPKVVAFLGRQVAEGRFDEAAAQARCMVQLLAEYGDRALVLLDGAGMHERYFTALVVDVVGHVRADELTHKLAARRSPGDERAYRLLGVDSIADALCAVACNDAIQACVFGPVAPWRGARDAPWLGPTLLGELDRLAATPEPPMTWLVQRLERVHPRLRLIELGAPASVHEQLMAPALLSDAAAAAAGDYRSSSRL